ncbi:MAG: hypothetical protein WAO23_05695 [Dethiobacteria bacterium]
MTTIIFFVIQSEAKNLGFLGKHFPFIHKQQQNMWPEVTPGGVIPFRVMMEVLVVVKILRLLKRGCFSLRKQ